MTGAVAGSVIHTIGRQEICWWYLHIACIRLNAAAPFLKNALKGVIPVEDQGAWKGQEKG